MPFELVTTSVGGQQLHGIVQREKDARGAVVHVHGSWGNFYGNPFIRPLADAYTSRGYSFASLNFPGHDETAISERIPDFVPALDSWLEALDFPGELVLQGHSLGAVKIAYAMREGKLPERSVAVVLLAPFDVVAFYSRATNGAIDELHDRLSRIEQQSDGALVPRDLFDMWMISPATMRAATTPGGDWDQFPTRVDSPGRALQEARLPVLALLGGDDFAASPNPLQVVTTLSRAQTTQSDLIEGAPHNFSGQEERLISKILLWLEKTLR